jgi:uncharacterized Zn finger protein (UPF0148 family)
MISPKTSGIFRLVCPACGTKLVANPDGTERCPDCLTRYSVMFGCLVRASDPMEANGPVQSASS